MNTPPSLSPDFALLPCPFCGVMPVHGLGLLRIYCDNLACWIKPWVEGKTETEAWTKWNTRHSPPASTGVDEALREIEVEEKIAMRAYNEDHQGEIFGKAMGLRRAVEILKSRAPHGAATVPDALQDDEIAGFVKRLKVIGEGGLRRDFTDAAELIERLARQLQNYEAIIADLFQQMSDAKTKVELKRIVALGFTGALNNHTARQPPHPSKADTQETDQ